MASSAISSIGSHTFTNSNLSSSKQYLNLSSHSHISLNSNFSKSNLLKIHSKSAPIKASLTDAVLANTESHYALLGISETDSIKEIKKAYKQLARKYHPDVSPAGETEEYTEKFIRVQVAYETLSDPERRCSYDRDMARGLGLHTNFTARSCRYGPGNGDTNGWEQRWQSQLAELIRRSNSKEFESSSWGDRMRSRNSTCTN